MITSLLAIALHVLVATFVFSLCQRIFKGTELNHYEDYFNTNLDGNSKAYKLTIYSAWAYVACFLLSFLIFPLAAVLPFIYLVTCVLAWWWLVETIQDGYVTQWVADIKKYFNK